MVIRHTQFIASMEDGQRHVEIQKMHHEGIIFIKCLQGMSIFTIVLTNTHDYNFDWLRNLKPNISIWQKFSLDHKHSHIPIFLNRYLCSSKNSRSTFSSCVLLGLGNLILVLFVYTLNMNL